MIAEVDKLKIDKLVYVPTSLNNLKPRVDELDIGKLKFVPSDLKKLSYVIHNEFVEKYKIQHVKEKTKYFR